MSIQASLWLQSNYLFLPTNSQSSITGENNIFLFYLFIIYYYLLSNFMRNRSQLWGKEGKKCLLQIEFSSNHCLKTLYDLHVFTSESEVPFSSWQNKLPILYSCSKKIKFLKDTRNLMIMNITDSPNKSHPYLSPYQLKLHSLRLFFFINPNTNFCCQIQWLPR